ncbi:hypothetical protein HPB47_006166, partial [Ixodes persulcatus]
APRDLDLFVVHGVRSDCPVDTWEALRLRMRRRSASRSTVRWTTFRWMPSWTAYKPSQVGMGCRNYLQHHNGARFMAAVSTMAAAQRRVAQGFLSLSNVEIPLESVGAHVVFVSVYRLPSFMSEEALGQVLAQLRQGKGDQPRHVWRPPGRQDRHQAGQDGISKPVPNFIHIQGYRVMVDYRGLRRVARPLASGAATAMRPRAASNVSPKSPPAAQQQPIKTHLRPPRCELPPSSPSQPPSIPVTTRTRLSSRGPHHLP